jgi:hypothetical protein
MLASEFRLGGRDKHILIDISLISYIQSFGTSCTNITELWNPQLSIFDQQHPEVSGPG